MAERASRTPADKAATTPTVSSGDPIVVGDTSGNTQLGSTATEGIPAGETAAPAPKPEDGNDALAPATVATKRYATDEYKAGALAPRAVYRTQDGQLVDELEPGTAGHVVVAEGDTITPGIARDLSGE